MPSIISVLVELDAQPSAAPPKRKWIATVSGRIARDTKDRIRFAKKLTMKAARIALISLRAFKQNT